MPQAKTLDEKELKAVLAHCSTRRHAKRDRALLLTGFWAGLRAKEIAALSICDVLAADGSIRAEFVLSPDQTKGKRARKVFLGSKLQRELAAYLRQKDTNDTSAPLFLSQKGVRFSPNSMSQLITHIYQDAGIVGATSHSCRRSFITNLAHKGVSVRVLAELAAHSSITTTQRYIDINDKHLRAAVELV